MEVITASSVVDARCLAQWLSVLGTARRDVVPAADSLFCPATEKEAKERRPTLPPFGCLAVLRNWGAFAETRPGYRAQTVRKSRGGTAPTPVPSAPPAAKTGKHPLGSLRIASGCRAAQRPRSWSHCQGQVARPGPSRRCGASRVGLPVHDGEERSKLE